MNEGAWFETIRLHAPLLVLCALLIGAAVALASPNGRLSWLVGVVAVLVSAVLAADLAGRALFAGVSYIRHDALALTLDSVGAFAAPLVLGVGLLVTVAAGALLRDVNAPVAPFAVALLLLSIAGWVGALLAADLVALCVAVVWAWLGSVGLVALSAERDRGALNGALRMLTAGGVAAAFMLLGVGLLARSLGSTQLTALADAQVAAPNLARIGVGLLLLGLALKAGAAPLHAWLGAAVGRAGGLAGLALGALGVVGALAVLLRVAAFAFAAPELGGGVAAALVTLGAVCVVVGSIQAIGARSLRRMAAYAGVAQVGCVLLSAALGSPAGFAAALVQILGFGAAALALFGGAAVVGGDGAHAALDGLGRRAPLASAALTAGALSLMGAPLTLGFLGRWRMIEAGVGVGWWWATGAVIAASLAAVVYGGRLIERLYFRKLSAPLEGGGDLWRFALAPALLAATIVIGLGLEPLGVLQATSAAAAALAGGARP